MTVQWRRDNDAYLLHAIHEELVKENATPLVDRRTGAPRPVLSRRVLLHLKSRVKRLHSINQVRQRAQRLYSWYAVHKKTEAAQEKGLHLLPDAKRKKLASDMRNAQRNIDSAGPRSLRLSYLKKIHAIIAPQPSRSEKQRQKSAASKAGTNKVIAALVGRRAKPPVPPDHDSKYAADPSIQTRAMWGISDVVGPRLYIAPPPTTARPASPASSESTIRCRGCFPAKGG